MREILFRGKRVKDGQWEYGDLWCNPYGKRVVCIMSPINDQGTTGGNEVDPETVGQYTGFKDSNGNKIFEGDICNFCNNDGGFTDYEVLWFGGKWAVRKTSYNAVDDLDLFFCERSVVIGNIYDNPELMKGDNND